MQIGRDCIGVSVGAIVINSRGEILLGKRSKLSRNERGKWEAPGGEVNFGEKREDAIKREVHEELGVKIKILKVLHSADEILVEDKQHWLATTYIAKIIGNKKPAIMEPKKCEAIGWFSIIKLPKPLSHVTTVDLNEFKRQYKEAI